MAARRRSAIVLRAARAPRAAPTPPTPSCRGAPFSSAACGSGEIELVKQPREQRASLRVFVGQRGGGRLHVGPVARLARRGWPTRPSRWPAITAPDPHGGPARAGDARRGVPDLELYDPGGRRLSPEARIERAARARGARRARVDPRIANSEGARVRRPARPLSPTQQPGFAGGYAHVDASASLRVAGRAARRRRCSATTGTRRRRSARGLERAGRGRARRRRAARCAGSARAASRPARCPSSSIPRSRAEPAPPPRRRVPAARALPAGVFLAGPARRARSPRRA